jgi:hypothetical protein
LQADSLVARDACAPAECNTPSFRRGTLEGCIEAANIDAGNKPSESEKEKQVKNRSLFPMLAIVFAATIVFVAATPRMSAQTVCGNGTVSNLGNSNQYMFLGDQWNGSFTYVDQCVQVTNSTTPPPTSLSGTGAGPSTNYVSGTFDNTTDTPSDYPDFLYGAFQGSSTSNTQLPMAVTNITGSSPKYDVLSGENVVEPSGYNNDMAYDIWFNTYAGTPTNANTTGTELMIWVQHNGGAGTISGGPTYSFTDPTTGQGWTAYTGTNTGNCNCSGTGSQVISFVRNNSDGPTPAGGLTEALNLDDFFTEALNVGQIQSSWYLTAVEFGTEIWIGGPGLEVNNFWVNVVPAGGGTTTEGPYGGTPAAIPGTVLAENYDTGGQGVAYNVSSTNGTDNGYRSQGVDLETASSPATGNDLGWSAAGQWFKYTVNVSTAGTYTVSFLVAAESAISDAFHLSNSSGTNLTGSVAVPDTGGWQTWTTATATVTLPAGKQTLTLNEDNTGWNIDSAAFALNSSGGGGGGATLNTGTPYNIVNENSGSCIGASGQATANGTAVQQYTCANGTYSTQLSQQWIFTSAGNGYYEVSDANATGETWNVTGNGTTNGSLVQLWTYAGNSNEEWEPVSLGNGYYKFVGQGSGLCLDTPSDSTANSLQYDIYTCNGTEAQAFKLVTP